MEEEEFEDAGRRGRATQSGMGVAWAGPWRCDEGLVKVQPGWQG